MERTELKQLAKNNIRMNFWGIIGVFFLIKVVLFILSLVASYTYIGSFFVTNILTIGTILYTLNIARGKEYAFKDLFAPFNEFYLKKVGTMALYTLFMFLWIILSILTLGIAFFWTIPKIFGYSMVPYILANEDISEMGAVEIIDYSTKIMDGHKMEYFVLMLSFILWGLGTILTLGILGLYTGPYYSITMAHFYLYISK